MAVLIKRARFQNIRIDWDNSIKDKNSIKKQIDLLVKAGYPAKDISVFMIYNFDIPYEEVLKKLDYCKKWGVQITDCRYRPLELDYDNYNPHMRDGQPEGSYYIHKKAGWTDKKIRKFRKKVRTHNIWIRYAKDKGLQYDPKMERWSAIHNTFKFFNLGRPPPMEKIEKSAKLQRRIRLLNRLKENHKKQKIPTIDLNSCSKKELDEFLDKGKK